MVPILSGCLVSDKSSSNAVEGDLTEVRPKTNQIIDNFFFYNEYNPEPSTETDTDTGTDNDTETDTDTTNYSSFDVAGLISLLNQDKEGAIVEIDPILGPSYDKTYDVLEDELWDQQNVFERQEEYKLVFQTPRGNKSYKRYDDSLDGDYYTAKYLFQVFEEKDGKLVLTDNGHITFELKYSDDDEWSINYIFIDYRELGSVSLD